MDHVETLLILKVRKKSGPGMNPEATVDKY
jgi:hypothetical protein